MKKMMKKWMVLTAVIIAVLAMGIQAGAANSHSGNKKTVVAYNNLKAPSVWTTVTFRQFKGVGRFTKWKSGYGTVAKEKQCYATYKIQIKDNKGNVQTKYLKDGKLTFNLIKGRKYTITVTYDAAKTKKNNKSCIYGEFDKWITNSKWDCWYSYIE